MSEELVKVDETALKTKVTELETKIAQLAQTQMPDDIKQKLKDVLTWIITTL
jgi:phage shock protein A